MRKLMGLALVAGVAALSACATAFDDRAALACKAYTDPIIHQECVRQNVDAMRGQTLQAVGAALAAGASGAAQSGSAYAPAPNYATPAPAPQAGASACFFRNEVTSGFNKICYYDCLGSLRAVTQAAVSLCPLTL